MSFLGPEKQQITLVLVLLLDKTAVGTSEKEKENRLEAFFIDVISPFLFVPFAC